MMQQWVVWKDDNEEINIAQICGEDDSHVKVQANIPGSFSSAMIVVPRNHILFRGNEFGALTVFTQHTGQQPPSGLFVQ